MCIRDRTNIGDFPIEIARVEFLPENEEQVESVTFREDQLPDILGPGESAMLSTAIFQNLCESDLIPDVYVEAITGLNDCVGDNFRIPVETAETAPTTLLTFLEEHNVPADVATIFASLILEGLILLILFSYYREWRFRSDLKQDEKMRQLRAINGDEETSGGLPIEDRKKSMNKFQRFTSDTELFA